MSVLQGKVKTQGLLKLTGAGCRRSTAEELRVSIEQKRMRARSGFPRITLAFTLTIVVWGVVETTQFIKRSLT